MSEQENKDFGNFLKTYYSILGIKAGKNFNLTDKMVLLVVLSLNDPKKHCYAKNKYISEILGLSQVTVSASIGKLCEDLQVLVRKGARQARVLIPIPSKELIKKLNEVSDEVIKSLNEVIKSLNEVIKKPNESHKESLPASSRNLVNSLRSLDLIDNNKTNKLDKKIDDNKLLSDKASDDSNSKGGKIVKNKDKAYAPDSFAYITSEYLLLLVLQNYPNFDRRLQNLKYRERKLQNSAKEIDLMVRVDMCPEDEIIDVIEWASQDSFWKQNIKSGSKLRKQYGELLIRIHAEGTPRKSMNENPLIDSNPELTAKFEEAHRQFAGRRWSPSVSEKNKFIMAAVRAAKTVKNIDQDWVQKEIIVALTDALKQYYSGRGNPVWPGCWCSDFTWDKLLPQALLSMGVPESQFFKFPEEEVE